MGATSRRSKGRPVRSASKSLAFDDTSDVDPSYDPKTNPHPARTGRRRSHSDNGREAFYFGEGGARDCLYIRITRLWQSTPSLIKLVATILILIAGCISLSLLTDVVVSSAYAIACRTPTSWIHWTGLPWLFQPNEACTSTDQDPYEAIWDDLTGTTALLEISETSRQLQRSRDASENYSY